MVNFDDNCKMYSKEVLVNEINGIINFDKFSRSYDDLICIYASLFLDIVYAVITILGICILVGFNMCYTLFITVWYSGNASSRWSRSTQLLYIEPG